MNSPSLICVDMQKFELKLVLPWIWFQGKQPAWSAIAPNALRNGTPFDDSGLVFALAVTQAVAVAGPTGNFKPVGRASPIVVDAAPDR